MEDNMTLSVNEANDIYLVNGDLAVSSGKTAQGQIISAAIRTRRGELQLDTERGIPYFETVFESPSKDNIDLWESSVRDTIMGFNFVESIEKFDIQMDYERNVLRYSAKVKTVDGDILSVNG